MPDPQTPPKGGHEQRDQDGDHGLRPGDDVPRFKIRASCHLGFADLVRFLHQCGDESEGDGHHHGELMGGELEHL